MKVGIDPSHGLHHHGTIQHMFGEGAGRGEHSFVGRRALEPVYTVFHRSGIYEYHIVRLLDIIIHLCSYVVYDDL